MAEESPTPINEEFISEPIEPVPGRFSADLMSQGLASLPGAFTWRGERYVITECLDHIKLSRPEGYTSDGERYLRRQQFRVRLDSGQIASIYFERQARRGAGPVAAKKRWVLYTISAASEPENGD